MWFFLLVPSLFSRHMKEGRVSSFPSFPHIFFLMKLFSLFAVCLEVSLALFTSHEVLSVVQYDLSLPKSQVQCHGSTIALFVSSALEIGFVQVLRSSFLKVRFTFLRWSQPLTRLSTISTGAPAPHSPRPFLLPTSTCHLSWSLPPLR
jgi:hypothetical protein